VTRCWDCVYFTSGRPSLHIGACGLPVPPWLRITMADGTARKRAVRADDGCAFGQVDSSLTSEDFTAIHGWGGQG
jgi:hypothetical protein